MESATRSFQGTLRFFSEAEGKTLGECVRNTSRKCQAYRTLGLSLLFFWNVPLCGIPSSEINSHVQFRNFQSKKMSTRRICVPMLAGPRRQVLLSEE